MADEKDQDALAAEWAAALEEQDDQESAGGETGEDDELLDEVAVEDALVEAEEATVSSATPAEAANGDGR